MDINLKFFNNEYFSTKLENYLAQLFQIDKEIVGIVLFGSLARGDAIYSEEKRSDIDLIIIFKDNELPEHHRNFYNFFLFCCHDNYPQFNKRIYKIYNLDLYNFFGMRLIIIRSIEENKCD